MSTRFRTRQPAGRWGCPDPGSTSTKTALPPRAARRQALTAEVRQLFAAHRKTYGSPRIAADLREAGCTVSQNTVAAIMREQGLTARRKKKRRATTRPGRASGGHRTWSSGTSPRSGSTASGTATAPDIPTGQGKLYLARWTWPPGG